MTASEERTTNAKGKLTEALGSANELSTRAAKFEPIAQRNS